MNHLTGRRMGTLFDRLSDDLKHAMKARDEVRLRTIRSLRAAIQEKEISERSGGTAALTDEQEMAVVQRQAKQRQDAIDQYASAGREDLVQREREELVVIQSYLPEQLSDESIRDAVRRIVLATGATSLMELGIVMGAAMQELRGKADGKRVQQIVREELTVGDHP